MVEVKQRKAFASGHERKFLIIVDDSPECEAALFFAARVANRTGGIITLLYNIEPKKQSSWSHIHVGGVDDGARDRADKVFKEFRSKLKEMGFGDLKTETITTEGKAAEQIVNLINTDEDISILVLGASADKWGPGPLVTWLSSTVGTFPIPVYIVPGTLSMEDIEALA